MRRWRGLKALVVDAVDHGSRAVERLHLETARLPFAILEQIPGIAEPAKVVHVVHDVVVQGTHGVIRLVTRAAGGAIDVVLDVVEEQRAEGEERR